MIAVFDDHVDYIKPELRRHWQAVYATSYQDDRPMAKFDRRQPVIVGNDLAFSLRHEQRMRFSLDRCDIAQDRAMVTASHIELRLAILVEEKHLKIAMRQVVSFEIDDPLEHIMAF